MRNINDIVEHKDDIGKDPDDDTKELETSVSDGGCGMRDWCLLLSGAIFMIQGLPCMFIAAPKCGLNEGAGWCVFIALSALMFVCSVPLWYIWVKLYQRDENKWDNWKFVDVEPAACIRSDLFDKFGHEPILWGANCGRQ